MQKLSLFTFQRNSTQEIAEAYFNTVSRICIIVYGVDEICDIEYFTVSLSILIYFLKLSLIRLQFSLKIDLSIDMESNYHIVLLDHRKWWQLCIWNKFSNDIYFLINMVLIHRDYFIWHYACCIISPPLFATITICCTT